MNKAGVVAPTSAADLDASTVDYKSCSRSKASLNGASYIGTGNFVGFRFGRKSRRAGARAQLA